jgi:hypothetical protein
MFAHQVEPVRGELHRMQGAATFPRFQPRVRGPPAKLDPDQVRARKPQVRDRGNRCGMPVEPGVEVVEQPVPGHVDLRPLRLLRGAAVDADRPSQAERRSRLLRGDRRAGQGRAEQVVPTAVPACDAVRARLLSRHRLIAEAGQRVILGQEPDRRPARCPRPFGHERRRDPGCTGTDGEARCLELAKMSLRRLLLVQAHL